MQRHSIRPDSKTAPLVFAILIALGLGGCASQESASEMLASAKGAEPKLAAEAPAKDVAAVALARKLAQGKANPKSSGIHETGDANDADEDERPAGHVSKPGAKMPSAEAPMRLIPVSMPRREVAHLIPPGQQTTPSEAETAAYASDASLPPEQVISRLKQLSAQYASTHAPDRPAAEPQSGYSSPPPAAARPMADEINSRLRLLTERQARPALPPAVAASAALPLVLPRLDPAPGT